MKPTVRRARTTNGQLADGWILTRPGYGFQPTEIIRKPTWRQAHEALHTAPGSASTVVERNVADYVPGLTQGSARPRWIET